MVAFAVIIVLVFAAAMLVIYNMSLHRKIEKYNNVSRKIANLNVLQDFMSTLGDDLTVDQKIKRINDILIERYEIKYSTIVVFDGSDYVVKASNVAEKHWEALRNLHEAEVFQDSIATATPKYITVNNESERLEYQKTEFGRAKSAIFFPLTIDNVYIGYWIIESGTPHDFDNVDTTILEIVKDNIISVLRSVVHQKTLESIVRTDLFSGLQSAEYLYGEGKKKIEQFTTSTICMFKIVNLERINKEFSREMGNRTVTEVSKHIKNNISADYIFVRYMGPKFVIVFPGVDANGVAKFLNDIKEMIEKLDITLEEDVVVKTKTKKKTQKVAKAKLNFVVSSYYKGTGLEEVLKSLEGYLDNADPDESDINSI